MIKHNVIAANAELELNAPKTCPEAVFQPRVLILAVHAPILSRHALDIVRLWYAAPLPESDESPGVAVGKTSCTPCWVRRSRRRRRSRCASDWHQRDVHAPLLRHRRSSEFHDMPSTLSDNTDGDFSQIARHLHTTHIALAMM